MPRFLSNVDGEGTELVWLDFWNTVDGEMIFLFEKCGNVLFFKKNQQDDIVLSKCVYNYDSNTI